MTALRWGLFAAGWVAVVLGGFLAPRTFLGLVALFLDAVAFACFLAAFAALRPDALSTARQGLAWVAVVVGAGMFPLVADFGIGGSFAGPGAQAAGIRRFPTFADALGHVTQSAGLMTAAALAPLGLAVGWKLARVPVWQAAAVYALCLAAYPAIVWLLHAV
jgi:hypothetical protein